MWMTFAKGSDDKTEFHACPHHGHYKSYEVSHVAEFVKALLDCLDTGVIFILHGIHSSVSQETILGKALAS